MASHHFGVGSLGCGVAPSTGVLIGARVLQGVGAAFQLPGTLAIITHAFPERREQARAIGIWAGVGSVALPAGPLLGGAVIGAVGWRAVFLVNLPIVIGAFAVAARVIHESAEPQGRRLDLPGTALGAVVLAVVTYAFVEAGHAGLGAGVLIAIVVSLAALGAFLAVERSRDRPMLPLELFRRAELQRCQRHRRCDEPRHAGDALRPHASRYPRHARLRARQWRRCSRTQRSRTLGCGDLS